MSKIVFYPKSDLVKEIIPSPKPITVPDWFKKMPVTKNEEPFNVSNGEKNHTAKLCLPFLDSLTMGYSFNLWCDIQVKIDPFTNAQVVTWLDTNQELSPVIFKEETSVPTIDGYNNFDFSWMSHWGVKTPKGYSAVFTHPYNRFDLPFITSTGVMDTDRWGIWGPQPFALKKGWEGVIPAGTPVIQFYPVKRDSWKSEIDESLTKWGNMENIRRSSKFRGYYKNHYWERKTYS
jgi:hypothetical protein